MPFGFHGYDLIVILIIALLIFGPRKLPEIGSAVGKSIREFKKATSVVVEQVEPTPRPPEPKQISAAPASSESAPALAASIADAQMGESVGSKNEYV